LQIVIAELFCRHFLPREIHELLPTQLTADLLLQFNLNFTTNLASQGHESMALQVDDMRYQALGTEDDQIV